MIALAVMMLALAACHGDPAAKAGAQTVTLRFATAEEAVNNNGQMQALTDFVTQVESLSHGQLRPDVQVDVGHGTPGSEEALLKAVRRGTYDVALNPTRSFAPAGFAAFEALEAPFVLQSYAAEQQALTGIVGRRMLARLRGSGLTGLALVTGPLRRPFGTTRPLVQPTDWRGLSFRVYRSRVQLATASALGAQPAPTGSRALGPLLQSGKLGGLDFDTAQYDLDGFADLEHYETANLTMWPKSYAVIMNTNRLSSLTPQQRRWLIEAAQHAAQEPTQKAFDETATAGRLCLTGVHFAYASAPQLDRLRTAVEPVYAMLRRDQGTAADLTALQAIDAAHPTPSSPTVPAGCRGVALPATAVDTHLTTRPRIPDGDYRVSVTAEDIEQFGSDPTHATGNAGIATMTLAHGTYAAHFIFVGSRKSELVEAGRLSGTKRSVVFSPDASVMRRLGDPCSGCSGLPAPYSFGYFYADGHLTLTVGAGTKDPVILAVATSHPWLRIS
jgi:TRAP-type C4-dicarboxylate transport system substrate-binding protein